MKKRILSFILILSMVLTSVLYFVACDNNNKETEGESKPEETESVADTESETDAPTDAPTDVPTDEATEKDTVTETSSETVDESVADTESSTETSSETESLTETETVTETETESESETEKETECYHPYDATIEGHWKPACDKCGKGEGKMQSHEFVEKVEDEGDLLLYSFRCPICKYRAYSQEVPYEINLFYSAGELSKTEYTGTGCEQGFGFDSGVGFGRYYFENGGGLKITVMSNGEANAPTGKYLVMKVRLPRSQSSFSATIKSVGADASYPMSFQAIPSGWVTVVVDITKVVNTTNTTDATTGEQIQKLSGYQPDASGDYYLGEFIINASIGVGESFDIAYVLLCDKVEDAKAFIENEKTVITYDDILNSAGDTSKKECVDENGNPIIHKYIINDDGTHSLKETCYQCGLAAVENEPHTYMQTIVDGELTYACALCNASRFGANVNKYISAAEINNTAPTYYRITKNGLLTDADGGFEYSSISGQGGTAQVIFARNTEVSSDREEAASFNVGKGRYFVIRMRTNNVEQSFGINFSTTGTELYEGKKNGVVVGQFHTSKTLNFPTAVAGVDKWATYVVDLAAVIPQGYAPDENGEFVLHNFYFHIGNAGFTDDVDFDVHYAAFVDNWEEVAALVDDETVINVTSSNYGSYVKTEDATCVGEHSYAMVEVEGKLVGQCAVCGHINENYELPPIQKYYDAEYLYGKTEPKTHVVAGSMNQQLMDEGGEKFVRVSNIQPNGNGWMGWNPLGGESAPVSGQYMAIKLRVGENGLGQTSLSFYISTVNTLVAGQHVAVKVSEDGQWHTIVVDLSTRISDPANYFVADGDGYHVRYFQIRVMSGYQTTAEADDYMDIAYVAFFNKLSCIPDIVDTETYEWSTSSTTSSERVTEGDGCVDHTIVGKVEGNTHTATCGVCGQVVKTFTVDESINWFSPLDKMGTMSNSLAKFEYDKDADVLYNRYSGSSASHANISGGTHGGAYTEGTFQTGNYVVIKYRLSGSMTFRIATDDFGFQPGMNPDRPYFATLGVRENTDGLSDWQVAIIEIPDGLNYTKNAEHKIGVRFDTGSEYVFDVAYVAIVDSKEEAALLLEEGEVLVDLGSSWDNVTEAAQQ